MATSDTARNSDVTQTCTLDRLRRGESCQVVAIGDEAARITALRFGMAEGACISCVTRVPAGPLVVRSGLQEIAIGRALARKIDVLPIGKGC